MNLQLLELLYKKYIYKDAQGIKSNWDNIMIDYKEQTGKDLVKRTARAEITPEIRDKLYSQHLTNDLPPKETEFRSDGTQKLLAYTAMSEEDSKNPERVMELNGYDPNTWDLINLVVNEWTARNADNIELYNYQIKLTVKPKINDKIEIKDIEFLLNNTNIEPIIVEKPKSTEGNLLITIPLFDMHFGNMKFEDYQSHQEQILERLARNEWETALFFIGQDLFHNDDFRGHTSSQTRIDKEDMEQAWNDAHNFYQPIIRKAMEQCENVQIIYSKGNHDETIGYTFVRSLEFVFPQACFDTKQSAMKSYTHYNVFQGATHGDRLTDKKIVRAFESNYRIPMAKANRRILYRGHLHTMKSFDDNGTHVFALGTGNKADQWHEDNGFIGNHKAFEIFVYNKNTMLEHLFIEN